MKMMPEKKDFNRSYTRRHYNHDYYSPCIYHIIFKKADGTPTFGIIKGDAGIAPGTMGCAIVQWSKLGRAIAEAIYGFPSSFPIIELYQYCIMPDHVHLLIRVKARSEHPLGYYMAHLKGRIAKLCGAVLDRRVSSDDIFQKNFTDKPVYPRRSLDALFRYIRENPHRLAMRMQHPEFFQRNRKIRIGEKEYEAYGNMFLFRNPDKLAVKISRSFTDEEKASKKSLWLAEASKGAVLVSPFISKEEKAVRVEAEKSGAKIILIVHEAFMERYKPMAHDFELCSAGRLLIITLGLRRGEGLSREICVRMNDLAREIADGDAFGRDGNLT